MLGPSAKEDKIAFWHDLDAGYAGRDRWIPRPEAQTPADAVVAPARIRPHGCGQSTKGGGDHPHHIPLNSECAERDDLRHPEKGVCATTTTVREQVVPTST